MIPNKDSNTSMNPEINPVMDSGLAPSKNLLWLLVKNRLIAQLGIHILLHEKDKRKKNGKITTIIALSICAIMLAFYCGAMAYGYAYMGLTTLIPSIALVISSFFTMFYTMFKTNGELFHYKDYDTLMSLPIPVKTIIGSRFLNMYLWNVCITILIMLPMGIVYGITTKPSLLFYFIWLFGMFIVSLIPTTVAAVIGAVITAISIKFKYSNAVSIVLSLLLIIGVVGLPMIAANDMNNGLAQMIDPSTGNLNLTTMQELAPIISQSIHKMYPPAQLFTRAVVEDNIGAFLLFVGISIGWYLLFIYVLSLRYKQIYTALTSHQSRSNYVFKNQQQSSMLKALVKKTTLRILKSSVCALNLLVGCVIAIVFSIAMVVVGPEAIQTSIEIKNFDEILNNVAAFIIAGMVCMTNTSVISLSLEGKNIWLIKSLPITPKTLYDSYLVTNFIFTIPTSLICSLLFCIALKTGLLATIIIFLTPIIFSVFTAVIGIFISNRMAFYNWPDETSLVKQSALSMIGILGGMVFLFLCGTVVNIGIIPIAPDLLTLIINGVILILTLFIYKCESTRPIKD